MSDTQQQIQKPSLGRRAMRIAQIAIGIAGLILVALILLGTFIEAGELPRCDSDDARDTMSDFFQSNDMDMARYRDIVTVSETEDEVSCTATLDDSDGRLVTVDYRFFWENEEKMYEVTNIAVE